MSEKKDPEDELRARVALLMATCHALMERSLVLETAFVGMAQLLVKENLLVATDVRDIADVITAVYPPDKRGDAGFLLACDLRDSLHVPFLEYVKRVYPRRGSDDGPMH